MRDTPPHLQALEEVERAGILGLLEVLREEGIEGVMLDEIRVSLVPLCCSATASLFLATSPMPRSSWRDRGSLKGPGATSSIPSSFSYSDCAAWSLRAGTPGPVRERSP
jgi:hypothetical protein